MSQPEHNFRSMTVDGVMSLVEVADRNNPATNYTKVITIHDNDAFIRLWNQMRNERAEEAFEAGWIAGAKYKS